MPTNPGHVPDQLATVRIGPLCASKPASTWCEYCQTASATMSFAVGIDAGEDAHAFFLRADEAVLLVLLVRMREPIRSRPRPRLSNVFHFLLVRPAVLIGREPQIAAGDEQNFTRRTGRSSL